MVGTGYMHPFQELVIKTKPGWHLFLRAVAGFSLYWIAVKPQADKLDDIDAGADPKTPLDTGHLYLLECMLGRGTFKSACPLILAVDKFLGLCTKGAMLMPETKTLNDKKGLFRALWVTFVRLQRERVKKLWPQGIAPGISEVLEVTLRPALEKADLWEHCQTFLQFRHGLLVGTPMPVDYRPNAPFAEEVDGRPPLARRRKALFSAVAKRLELGIDVSTERYYHLVDQWEKQIQDALARGSTRDHLHDFADNFHSGNRAQRSWTTIVESARQQQDTEDYITLETPVADYLSVRTANALARHLGIITFGGLMGVTEADIRGVENLGETSVTEARQALKIFLASQKRQAEHQRATLAAAKRAARKQRKQLAHTW